MDLAAGYALWLHYNRILYRMYRSDHFPLLCFDWPEELFHEQLEQVVIDLGLNPLDPDERFYSADLRTDDSHDWSGVPWRVRRLYGKLLRAANRSLS